LLRNFIQDQSLGPNWNAGSSPTSLHIYTEGNEEGNKDGITDGNEDGITDGNEECNTDGNEDGINEGMSDGDEDGNNDGNEDAVTDGINEGYFEKHESQVCWQNFRASSFLLHIFSIWISDSKNNSSQVHGFPPCSNASCLSSSLHS